MLAHDCACGSRVVEVDVREEQVPDVAELDAALAQPFLQPGERRRRAAVEKERAVRRLEQVDADRALEAAELQVDRDQRVQR